MLSGTSTVSRDIPATGWTPVSANDKSLNLFISIVGQSSEDIHVYVSVSG